jgi:hypothetical protein
MTIININIFNNNNKNLLLKNIYKCFKNYFFIIKHTFLVDLILVVLLSIIYIYLIDFNFLKIKIN